MLRAQNLLNMLKLRAQNSLNLLMAHVCTDLQCLAGVEPPRWPDALSICRIGYRVGRSRSPELAMPVHFLCCGQREWKLRVLHSRSRLQRQTNVHLDRRRRHLGLANVVDLDVVDERKRLARRKHRLLVHKLGLTAERLPAVEALNTTSSRDYQVPAGPLNMWASVVVAHFCALGKTPGAP